MERHESTIFDFTKDKNDKLLVTSHIEQTVLTPSMSVHCTDNGYDGFTMYITQGQAENLMRKLQKGIIDLEIYRTRTGTTTLKEI